MDQKALQKGPFKKEKKPKRETIMVEHIHKIGKYALNFCKSAITNLSDLGSIARNFLRFGSNEFAPILWGQYICTLWVNSLTFPSNMNNIYYDPVFWLQFM